VLKPLGQVLEKLSLRGAPTRWFMNLVLMFAIFVLDTFIKVLAHKFLFSTTLTRSCSPHTNQVKGTGDEEGLSIFCPPGGAVSGNLDIPQISNTLLLAENNNNDNDDANSHQTPPPQPPLKHHSNIPELVHQQGPWTCICGITNEEGTIRCEECFGWRESSATTTTTTTGAADSSKKKKKTAPKQQEYYTKIRHVLEYILQTKETEMDIKAADAYIGVISNAMELFGESSTNNNNDNDDDIHNHHHSIPMSPNGRMTRQRFSDIAWKENRTHYEKNSSRVGVEYQVDSLPVVGSDMVPEEEVL
jgi:hypothetical protein